MKQLLVSGDLDARLHISLLVVVVVVLKLDTEVKQTPVSRHGGDG